MKIIALEGNSQRLDGGAMFGNAPKALWSRFSNADDQNRILLRCRSLLVEHAGQKILFETGIGAFFPPELRERYGVLESSHVLLDALSMAGYSDSDVDAVVLSHLHFDHAGGLLDVYQKGVPPKLLFPNAVYYVSADNYQRARSPHARDRASFIPELQDLLEQSGRLRIVAQGSADDHDLGGWLKFRYSFGHTPGLMMSEITVGERKGLYASDLIPGAAWMNASLSMGYDRFAEQVLDEKRQILDEYLGTDNVIFFTHDPEWICGYVEKDDKGRFVGRGTGLVEWLQ